MSTQELVTSIVAEQEESTDQFLSIIQQKIEDAIEVKRIELASQMFAESKGECPECGKAKGDCECEDEEEEDQDEDEEEEDEDEEEEDEKEMKEEAKNYTHQVTLYSKDQATGKTVDKVSFRVKAENEKDAVKQTKKLAKKHYPDGAYNYVMDTRELNMKEETELNELSKDKLVSYVKSAMKNKKPSEKRMQGISTASKKLINMDEMADRVTVDKITTELGRGKGLPPKVTSKKIVVDKAALAKLGTVQEKAPPGAKYERMVKHIKKGYAKGGLTKQEKSIAYATAWKAKNKEMNEAAMTDAQQMAALGMKGAEKAKTMMALNAYRKHGDINKLSPGHRTLISGYMEKTGGLAAVNRGTAAQALKKERMQEE